MGQKRRIYSQEFREEALRLVESSGRSMREIEEELGITAGLLYKWRARYKQVQGQSVTLARFLRGCLFYDSS